MEQLEESYNLADNDVEPVLYHRLKAERLVRRYFPRPAVERYELDHSWSSRWVLVVVVFVGVMALITQITR